MIKKHLDDTTKQNLVLTILFTMTSCAIWMVVLFFIFRISILNWAKEKIVPLMEWPTPPEVLINQTPEILEQTENTLAVTNDSLITEEQDYLMEIAQNAIIRYKYLLFFYPVSQNTRLPFDFPTTTAQLPLTHVGDVTIAEVMFQSLTELIAEAKKGGFSPYLRSGFRSINDQYTAFSHYVTEATASGKNLEEARDAARQFSAEPGYSEHHLGLAVDLLDYYYRDWIVARNNYDKGLYLWLRQHAHEFGFVISYPPSADYLLAKPGSGYKFSEPWHLRFVGMELAGWLYHLDYLNPQNSVTVNGVLRDLYRIATDNVQLDK